MEDCDVHPVTTKPKLGDSVDSTRNTVKFILDDEDVAQRKSNVIESENQLNQVDGTNEANAGDLKQNLYYTEDEELLRTSKMNDTQCEMTHLENNVLEHIECATNEVTEKENGAKPKQCTSINSLQKTETFFQQSIASSTFNYTESLFPSPPIRKHVPLEGKEKVVYYKEGRAVTLEECFNNFCSHLDEFSRRYLK